MDVDTQIIEPPADQCGLWLYFTKGKNPLLKRAFFRFQPRDLLGELKYGSSGKEGFRWDKSIKAFCLLCVHYVIHSKLSDYGFEDDPRTTKQRPDAAESLNEVLSHSKGWHMQLFKSKRSNVKATLFRGVKTGSNSAKPLTKLVIPQGFLPPTLVRIYLGEEQLSLKEAEERLWGLLGDLRKQSADFRSLRGLLPDPANRSNVAADDTKPEPPPEPGKVADKKPDEPQAPSSLNEGNKSKDRDQLFTPKQLAFVLTWTGRSEEKPHGYLTLFRPIAGQSVYYFDVDRMNDSMTEIAEGKFVYCHIERYPESMAKAAGLHTLRYVLKDSEIDFLPQDFKYWMSLILEYKKAPVPFLKKLARAIGFEDRIHIRHGNRSVLSERVGIDKIIKYLNSAIKGPVIFGKDQIAGIQLRPETRLLLEKHTAGTELKMLNRLLLEDAYPYSFHTWRPFEEWKKIVNASVLKTDDANRIGWLEFPNGTATFYYDSIPAKLKIPRAGAKVQCRVARGAEAYDIRELP